MYCCCVDTQRVTANEPYGESLEVVDFAGIKAYSMSTKARDSAEDFNTPTAGSESRFPQGIWSDGTTMWVADALDKKIYAYNQPVSIKHTVQQQINRQQRGYIKAVDRDTGIVTIIWSPRRVNHEEKLPLARRADHGAALGAGINNGDSP